MFTLKSLSVKGIPAALEKAERYRLLNDPKEAESICLDVLTIDPENQKAVISLLLSITDQFGEGASAEVQRARELLPRIHDTYKRAYYAGIISERQAKAILKQGTPGRQSHAYEWFREAMDHFEKAEAIRPPDNDEAILRWNSCARIIMKYNLSPRKEEYIEPFLE
ncbi:MAG: hypothetical protein HY707_12660 [Ignavibacteriae bacterium]|nr:hypothetical protein [Ignavibacteriota bacterium]